MGRLARIRERRGGCRLSTQMQHRIALQRVEPDQAHSLRPPLTQSRKERSVAGDPAVTAISGTPRDRTSLSDAS